MHYQRVQPLTHDGKELRHSNHLALSACVAVRIAHEEFQVKLPSNKTYRHYE